MSATQLSALRFRLRTLLLVTTLLGLLLGHFTIRAREVASLRREVLKLGGQLVFTFQVDKYGNAIITPTHPVPQTIRNWIGDDFFTTPFMIDLSDRPINDGDLGFLKSNGSARQIRILKLDQTHISDKGIEIIASLPDLYWLQIPYTDVTDDGIRRLCKPSSRIEFLDVIGTKVGVGIIDDLTRLESLKTVIISLSDGGVAAFKAKMPNCQIYGNYNFIFDKKN